MTCGCVFPLTCDGSGTLHCIADFCECPCGGVTSCGGCSECPDGECWDDYDFALEAD